MSIGSMVAMAVLSIMLIMQPDSFGNFLTVDRMWIFGFSVAWFLFGFFQGLELRNDRGAGLPPSRDRGGRVE